MADPLTSILLSTHKERADFLELRHGAPQASATFGTQGFKPSSPIDLSTGFDDSNRTGQEQAWKTILETQPLLIFLTPLEGHRKSLCQGQLNQEKAETTI